MSQVSRTHSPSGPPPPPPCGPPPSAPLSCGPPSSPPRPSGPPPARRPSRSLPPLARVLVIAAGSLVAVGPLSAVPAAAGPVFPLPPSGGTGGDHLTLTVRHA